MPSSSSTEKKKQCHFGEEPLDVPYFGVAFLSHTDERLARLGALAEWSLHVDPPTTIVLGT
jgi:hypothetical protein